MRILSLVHQDDAGPGVFAEAIRERRVSPIARVRRSASEAFGSTTGTSPTSPGLPPIRGNTTR